MRPTCNITGSIGNFLLVLSLRIGAFYFIVFQGTSDIVGMALNVDFDIFLLLQIVKDVKFTVNQAAKPVEKGITKFNEKLHKISENMKRHDKGKRRTKDDSCISTTSPARRVIRGIDDPLLHGSISDSVASRKKHRKNTGYTSAESGGESSSDQTYGGYQVRGHRWITKE